MGVQREMYGLLRRDVPHSPRHGLRRDRGDAQPLPPRDRVARPLLVVRRRDVQSLRKRVTSSATSATPRSCGGSRPPATTQLSHFAGTATPRSHRATSSFGPKPTRRKGYPMICRGPPARRRSRTGRSPTRCRGRPTRRRRSRHGGAGTGPSDDRGSEADGHGARSYGAIARIEAAAPRRLPRASG